MSRRVFVVERKARSAWRAQVAFGTKRQAVAYAKGWESWHRRVGAQYTYRVVAYVPATKEGT